MTEVRDFVAALARAGKRRQEIKPLVDSAYGNKTLSVSQINRIIRAVKEGKNTSDQRHANAKKTKRTASIVAAVAAAVEADRRTSVRQLATSLGLSSGTVHLILTKDLGLLKKSERWVPKRCPQKRKRREGTSAPPTS